MTPARRSASRSTRPRKKARGSRGASRTTRLTVLAAVLVVVAVAGIAAVKFLQTPRGQAWLLDAGVSGYRALVWENVDTAMRDALEPLGLRGRIRTVSGRRHAAEAEAATRWRVDCPSGTDLVMVNLALTEAVRRVGGRVRESEEHAGGEVLRMVVGTQAHVTHRISIRRGEETQARGGEAKAPGVARLAIVIDDFGYARGGVVTELLAMDLPLSISILPGLPHSRYVLERAKRAGLCTLLHLPMEPETPERVDAQAITTAMSEREITALVERHLASLPGVDGVNNHQGSRATADSRVMRATIRALRGRGLFFLDSLTSPKSVAYNTAREMGVPAARNAFFLDDDTEDAGTVEERLHRLVALARRDGVAIGIAHPHRWTLEALKRSEDYLEDAGVELVPVCNLLGGAARAQGE